MVDPALEKTDRSDGRGRRSQGEEAYRRGDRGSGVELGIDNEVGPTLADEGGMREEGRPRGKVEENLPEHVVVWLRCGGGGGEETSPRSCSWWGLAVQLLSMVDLVGWESSLGGESCSWARG
jgi:hypothetical protein